MVMLRVTCISYRCMRLLCISCRRCLFAFLFFFFVFIVSHLFKFSVVIQIFLFPFICYLLYRILRMKSQAAGIDDVDLSGSLPQP